MQEEVTQRTVALCVEATKLSAGMLQQAMKKVLDEMQKGVTGHKSKLHHGKQTLRQLMKHNTGVSNIEITDQNIRAFSATAKKYGIDFALKKDNSGEIPRYAEHTKYLHTIGDRYGWDEGTYRANIGKIRNYIVPVFGSFPIWKITRVDMRQGFKDMLSPSLAWRCSKVVVARDNPSLHKERRPHRAAVSLCYFGPSWPEAVSL